MDIQIISRNKTIEMTSLKRELEQTLSQTGGGFTLSLKTPDLQLHSIDPTIIQAVIVASSALLVSLLTGVLSWIKVKCGRTIEIVFENGAKIVVPADISIERLEILIDRARILEQKVVRLVIK